MKRRDFLKSISAGLLAGYLYPHPLSSEERTVVSVAKGANSASVTKSALAALGSLGHFVSRGDVVLVKPNMSWDRLPEQAANTNPEVVRTLVEEAYAAGAAKVLVFDNTCNEPRRCYHRSGIAQAARKAGATVLFVRENQFRRVRMGGEVLSEWPVNKYALEVDKIINVAAAKHHSLSGLTLTMKNLMGLIGGKRNRLHQEIHACIADLAAFFRPTLSILDATRILKANGPQGGNLKDVARPNTVAASVDQVAVDSYGASLFRIESRELGFIVEAHRRGLGEMDLEKVELVETLL